MKKITLFLAGVFLSSLLAGCGYSTRSIFLGKIRTIHVEAFKNKVDFSPENARSVYLPLLEVKVTHAIADRFLFDGNLRIANKETADAILQGELIGYDRQALRYLENEDVQEYRINITVSLALWDRKEQKTLWTESSFVGGATFFTTGPLAKSEDTALEEALTDLGRRVVERTVENW